MVRFVKKRFLLLGIVCAILITGCESTTYATEVKQNDINTEVFKYQKYDLDNDEKIKLGNQNAPNTITLVFDYSCSWCHKWMKEALPVIKEKYINTKIANYIGQPIVLLNQTSFFLSKVDYSIEKNLPSNYYDIQLQFANETDKEDWGTKQYVQSVLNRYGLNDDVNELIKDNPDPITLTRKYTKNFDLEHVPTVYVNGIKIYNAFDLTEIDRVLSGDIKEGTEIKVPVIN